MEIRCNLHSNSHTLHEPLNTPMFQMLDCFHYLASSPWIAAREPNCSTAVVLRHQVWHVNYTTDNMRRPPQGPPPDIFMSSSTSSGPVQQWGTLLLPAPPGEISQHHVTAKLFIFKLLTYQAGCRERTELRLDVHFTSSIINLNFCWKRGRLFSKIIKQI